MWQTSRAICIEAIIGTLGCAVLGCTMIGCTAQSSAPKPAENQTASKKAEVVSTESSSPEPSSTEPDLERQVASVQSGSASRIRVTQSKVSGDKLKLLASVRRELLELQIDAGVVDDQSIERIAELSALEHLRLRESPITDLGIAKLTPAQLPELKILNLPQSQLSAKGLEHLVTFPKLSQLRLSGEKCDDSAAAVLATFPSLRSLHLIGPQFTDTALDHLAKAPKLSSLYIDDCRLSDAAWERLFAAKPNLHVHIDQQHHDRDPNAHD